MLNLMRLYVSFINIRLLLAVLSEPKHAFFCALIYDF